MKSCESVIIQTICNGHIDVLYFRANFSNVAVETDKKVTWIIISEVWQGYVCRVVQYGERLS